jgi:hypothetical protein
MTFSITVKAYLWKIFFAVWLFALFFFVSRIPNTAKEGEIATQVKEMTTRLYEQRCGGRKGNTIECFNYTLGRKEFEEDANLIAEKLKSLRGYKLNAKEILDIETKKVDKDMIFLNAAEEAIKSPFMLFLPASLLAYIFRRK